MKRFCRKKEEQIQVLLRLELKQHMRGTLWDFVILYFGMVAVAYAVIRVISFLLIRRGLVKGK